MSTPATDPTTAPAPAPEAEAEGTVSGLRADPARPQRAPGTTRRRVVTVSSIAALALAASATGMAVWSTHRPAPPDASSGMTAAMTVPVTSGAMVSEKNVTGTLQYASTVPLVAGSSGTVTELAAIGATITSGQVLYRIDTRPVVLMNGAMPAWRDFAADMSDGDDVRQLEENLKALGFFDGEPDARVGWGTTAAIRSWQKSLGLEQTGTISRSSIVFSDRALRINTVDSRVGAQVGEGAPLLQASAEEQVVALELGSADRGLAAAGTAVTIALADGGEISGTVSTVGTPQQKPGPEGQGTRVVLPVTIELADQARAAGLALSTVTVRFSSPLRDDVLTVPVDALVPLDDSAFAVELPARGSNGERTLIPVTVGAFSSGNVEISGDGIAAGVDVVVPTR